MGRMTVWLLAAMVVLLNADFSAAQSCTAQDADCDGIADRLERALLETYRPYFRFSRDNGDNETFRPTDVRSYLTSSEIDGTGSEGERVVLSKTELARTLTRLIDLNVNNRSSNILSNPNRGNYYINPDNGARRGVEWPQARASRRVGLYGHVVPIYLGPTASYDRTRVQSSADLTQTMFYKIEYWQFFGYSSNNKPLDQGDHEGDWDTVQLILRPGDPRANRPGQLMSVLFYAHGKQMAFDVMSRTSSVLMEGGMVTEMRGARYNLPVPNLRDQDSEDKARDHVLRMHKDPVTGSFTHPVVFIEHGGHEFWPSPFWDYTGAQKHGGDDTENSYLTETPPNLGEVEHPLKDEPLAELILKFNGYWGTYSREVRGVFSNNPPPGPALHYAWTWPVSSSVRWRLKGIEY